MPRPWLSTWTAEGGGTWVREVGNNAVNQLVNGRPTVFSNGIDSQGQQLSGTVEIRTTGDDDFVGFVLGYNVGDLTNSAADYILIDWKQSDQNTRIGFATRGLAISRVTGALGDNSGAWSHNPANNVTELARGTNLGSTGWADNTEYIFDLVFTSSRIQVFVDTVLEIDITGTFSNGGFGFYNYSQSTVRFGALTEDVAPEVPVPAAALLFAPVLLAGRLLRRKGKAA